MKRIIFAFGVLCLFSFYVRNGIAFEEVPPPLPNDEEQGALYCSARYFGSYYYNRTKAGSYAFSVAKCANGLSRGSTFCQVREYNGKIRADFDEGTLNEIDQCNKTIDDVIDELLNQDITFETIDQLGNLQIYATNSSSLILTQATDIVSLIKRVDQAANDRTVEISAEYGLRNLVEILSQLSQTYVSNENSSQNFGKEDANAVQNLQESTAKLLPSLCLISMFDTERKRWEMTTKNFMIEAENLRTNRSDDFVYEPKASEEERSNSSSTISVSVPANVINNAKFGRKTDMGTDSNYLRTVFIYYKEDLLFPSNLDVRNVLSVNVGLNASLNSNLKNPIVIKHLNVREKPGKTPIPGTNLTLKKTSFKCVYWNFTTSQWSDEGCWLKLESDVPECQCFHLTNFALLVVSEEVAVDFALEIFSFVGCCISIIALFVTVIVMICYKELRKHKPGKILLHLCTNLCISYIIFVSGISNAVGNPAVCTAVAFLLHYFFLVSWMWMGVYSYEVYREVIKVFQTYIKHFMIKACTLCYGAPAVISFATFGVTGGFHGVMDENDENAYRSENACWLQSYALYFGFLFPVGFILLANMIVFFMVICEINSKQKKNSNSIITKRKNNNLFLIALTATFTMGLTWTFGFLLLFTRNDFVYIIMGWLFAISSSLQGVGIFSLTILRRDDLRRSWWNSVRSRFGTKSYSLRVNTSSTSMSGPRLTSARSSRTNLVRQSTMQSTSSQEYISRL